MLPPAVNLRGTEYRVAEHEGIVVFTTKNWIPGNMKRISFQSRNDCWYVELDHGKDVMVSHVLAAMTLIEIQYGKNHNRKKK